MKLFVLRLSLLLALLPSCASAQDQAKSLDTEWLEVTRVVDGDTIYVTRGGEREKLRLLSVDTEEKLTGRAPLSPTKPETLFGEACAIWAQELFKELAAEGEENVRVALRFPEGNEARDIYGRLLCHVILRDGRDFNLMLVELGKSPYFNKYGNSLISHEAFVQAQVQAREKKLGIWNPDTNQPKDPKAPSAKRPYDRLLPWWNARAEAIAALRKAQAESPGEVVQASDPEELRNALARGKPVRVFCSINRFFDEDDGSTTVLLYGSRDYALRAVLPAGTDADLLRFLHDSQVEFRQNSLWLEGVLENGDRGPVLRAADKKAWSLAGPQPK